MTAPEPDGGSTVRRIMLGAQLRQLREANSISRDEAGYVIRASGSKISRMELGRVSFKERDVADLLAHYGVTDPGEQAALLALAREANTPGWWQKYSDVLPTWFHSYIGLEAAASLIRTYEIQFVPGLLQTEDYARAVTVLAHDRGRPDEIDRRVRLRIARQQLLTQPDAPRFWVVMDEAVLRRPIGGPDVMRDQIKALIAATELPNVTLQIMPFDFGEHAGAGGAFTILRFADTELPDVVYIEHLTSAIYMDKPVDVDLYVAAIELLCIDAAAPAETVEMLNDALKKV